MLHYVVVIMDLTYYIGTVVIIIIGHTRKWKIAIFFVQALELLICSVKQDRLKT